MVFPTFFPSSGIPDSYYYKTTLLTLYIKVNIFYLIQVVTVFFHSKSITAATSFPLESCVFWEFRLLHIIILFSKFMVPFNFLSVSAGLFILYYFTYLYYFFYHFSPNVPCCNTKCVWNPFSFDFSTAVLGTIKFVLSRHLLPSNWECMHNAGL